MFGIFITLGIASIFVSAFSNTDLTKNIELLN